MITYFSIGLLMAVLALIHQKYYFSLTLKEAFIEVWWAYPIMMLTWPIGFFAYIDTFITANDKLRGGK